RRHTRFSRDWSSDVCSSDLAARRHRVRPRPSRDADGGRRQHSRGDRVPEDADRELPDDGRAEPGGSGAAARGGHQAADAAAVLIRAARVGAGAGRRPPVPRTPRAPRSPTDRTMSRQAVYQRDAVDSGPGPAAAVAAPEAALDSVVVVHGLWMPGWEMSALRRRLAAAGYSTYQFVYPTVDCGLDENADRLAEFVASTPGRRIHFVGHSL